MESYCGSWFPILGSPGPNILCLKYSLLDILIELQTPVMFKVFSYSLFNLFDRGSFLPMIRNLRFQMLEQIDIFFPRTITKF